MMVDTSLGKLYRARLRAKRQIAKLEPQLEGYREHLADVEAKIIKLDGLLFLPPPDAFNPQPATLKMAHRVSGAVPQTRSRGRHASAGRRGIRGAGTETGCPAHPVRRYGAGGFGLGNRCQKMEAA
jgi:hypothetical protein